MPQAAADLQQCQAPGEGQHSPRGLVLAPAGTVAIAGALGAVVTGNWHILLAVLAGAVVVSAIGAALMIWVMNNVDRY